MDSGVWLSVQSGLVYVRNDAALLTFFIVTAAITFSSTVRSPSVCLCWQALAFLKARPPLAADRWLELSLLCVAQAGAKVVRHCSAGCEQRPGSWAGVTRSSMIRKPCGGGCICDGNSQWLCCYLVHHMGAKPNPAELLGRMMSLLIFAVVGLNPYSATLAGLLIKLNETILFGGAGS